MDEADIADDVLVKSVIDVVFSSRKNTVMAAALKEFKNTCIKYHLHEKISIRFKKLKLKGDSNGQQKNHF